MRTRELLTATAFLTALTVLMTWPQAWYLGSRVAPHGDAFLSMWRLEWITHALTTNVRHLFDGNIFYPHARTLAFTDATLLEGFLAFPFLWAHANPVPADRNSLAAVPATRPIILTTMPSWSVFAM